MTTPGRTIIRAEGLCKEFSGTDHLVRVLDAVDLTIETGDYLAITGASGSGKSTLLHTLGLLQRPTAGRLELFGRQHSEIGRREAARLRNRHLGFVFQQSLLIPALTVLENTALPLVYAEVPRVVRLQRAREVLEDLGLSHRLEHPAVYLSGGESQRTAIARALVNDPELILADEPTGNLDSANSEQLMRIFDRLHDQGRTIVVVTHDPAVAAHCERNLLLVDGRFVN